MCRLLAFLIPSAAVDPWEHITRALPGLLQWTTPTHTQTHTPHMHTVHGPGGKQTEMQQRGLNSMKLSQRTTPLGG